MNIRYLNPKSQALILCLYVTDNTVYVTYIWYKIILIPLLHVEMSKKGQGLKIIARPTIVIIPSFHFVYNSGYFMVCYKIHDLMTFCLTRYGQMLFEDSNIQHIYSAVSESILSQQLFFNGISCLHAKNNLEPEIFASKVAYTPVHTYIKYVGTKLSQQVMQLV